VGGFERILKQLGDSLIDRSKNSNMAKSTWMFELAENGKLQKPETHLQENLFGT